jgi:hypothetical protein
MEVSGQLHTPAAFPPGERDARYPLDGWLGGPQNRSNYNGDTLLLLVKYFVIFVSVHISISCAHFFSVFYDAVSNWTVYRRVHHDR